MRWLGTIDGCTVAYSPPGPSPLKPQSALASRLGRHASVYICGSVAVFALSLLNVVVLTRFLAPAEFGRLGVLLVFASMLTVLYNLGSLQGTFRHVFGSSADEEAHDGERVASGPSSVRRRALGTGILLTAAIAALGTCLIALLARPFARLLLGDAFYEPLILLAAASAALGSLWRIVSNVARYARRPFTYVLVNVGRPVVVLGVSLPLVASGHGIRGALIGLIAGTLVSITIGVASCGSHYKVAFDPSAVRAIARRGIPFMGIVVAFWVIQNVDLYIVSAFASDSQTGLYRFASRLSSGISYFVSAFLMAWGPLIATDLHAEVKRTGQLSRTNALVVTYLLFGSLWVLLLLAAASDVIVGIAPASYGGAQMLVPLLGLGFMAYGWFVVLYRASRFPRRRRWYGWLAFMAMTLFLALALLVAGPFGAVGVATAQFAALLLACVGMLILSQRGPQPLPLPWRRLGVACAVFSVTLAGLLAGPAVGGLGEAAAVVVSAGFPLTLVACGAIPRQHLAELRRIAVAGLTRRDGSLAS